VLDVLKIYKLQREIFIKAPQDEVFYFFSQAENLNTITPPWLHFEIWTPLPIKMAKQTRIDYSLRLLGLRFLWKTEITEWQPPHLFIDKQIKGPYRHWEHTHRFERKDQGTVMQDIVRYAVPGFVLAPLGHFFLVRPRLEKIFSYREEALLRIFHNLNHSEK
jgi:ligand-binding SRPBCC domain-containing protein